MTELNIVSDLQWAKWNRDATLAMGLREPLDWSASRQVHDYWERRVRTLEARAQEDAPETATIEQRVASLERMIPRNTIRLDEQLGKLLTRVDALKANLGKLSYENSERLDLLFSRIEILSKTIGRVHKAFTDADS